MSLEFFRQNFDLAATSLIPFQHKYGGKRGFYPVIPGGRQNTAVENNSCIDLVSSKTMAGTPLALLVCICHIHNCEYINTGPQVSPCLLLASLYIAKVVER